MNNNSIQFYDQEININEFLMVIEEYLEVYFAISVLGIDTFYFGGGRMSGKTWFLIIFIIFDMIKNPYSSWIVIMYNKSDHSDRTMREFVAVINEIFAKQFPEFGKEGVLWEKKDSMIDKKILFYLNKTGQVIQFIGENDLDKGTLTPPLNNYWSGMWFEEVSGSNDATGINEEQQQKVISAFLRMKLGLLRFIKNNPNLHKSFLTFYTFNPYNEDLSIIKNYIDNHDSRIKTTENMINELKENGYTSTIDMELKEMYLTTNYKLMTKYNLLPKQITSQFEILKKNDYVSYLVSGLGLAGKSYDTPYGSIWNHIEKYQKDFNLMNKTRDRTWINALKIGIDIGNGGRGSTSMRLIGRFMHDNKQRWTVLKFIEINKSKTSKFFNPEEVVIKLIEQIKKWEYEYSNVKQEEIPIIMDNDPWFKSNFMQLYEKNYGIDNMLQRKYKVFLFTEKYLKMYKKALRPEILRPLFSTNMIVLNKENDPIIFNEYKNKKYAKNFIRFKEKSYKDIMDGNDDATDTLELVLFHELKYLYKSSNLDKTSKFYKEMFSF